MSNGTKQNVLVICGSLRKGSYNAAVARALPALAPEGMSLKSAPPFDGFPLYNADLHADGNFPAPVNTLADAIRASDGIIFVTPEYNYSMPGALKNAIDWVSRLKQQPFKDKAVLIQSASQGVLGGARMQYHLRQTMIFLDALVFMRPEVFVTFAQNKIDEKGELKDEPTRDIIKQQLAAFAKFIERVKPKA
jgi:chromate reductase